MPVNAERFVLAGLLSLVFSLYAGRPIQAADTEAPKKQFAATTEKDAERWQAESRELLFKLLKLDDLQATRQAGGTAIPFDVKLTKTENRDGYVWQELELNSTTTRRIKAVLTIPTGRMVAKHPGMVCIHGHGGSRYVVYDRTNIYHGFATELAEKGYVTISTDVGQHNVYEKDRTLMGERLWDVMRCADYVASLPDIDVSRIGCAGLSLGGEMAMWLGAMDPRMRVTVSSGYLTTVANMRVGHCQCWNFPGLTENFDFSDIYSLTAPRALSCQNGRLERSPGGFPVDLAEKAMDEIRKSYKVFDKQDRVDLDIHPAGHEFIVPTAVAFIEKNLR